jgi:hypothetical protein
LPTPPSKSAERIPPASVYWKIATSRGVHWRAIAGEFAHHLNGGTPRDFGPCGTVLDRNAAQLCSHPEIDFPYFSEAKPPLDEILLVPFYVEGTAVGTIWIVSHDAAAEGPGTADRPLREADGVG